MEVELLHYTPLEVCSHAIRTCWQSFDKSDNGGEKDRALIDRVGNKYKHSSSLNGSMLFSSFRVYLVLFTLRLAILCLASS